MQVKVHDYIILRAETTKQLREKVCKLLEEGWEPNGGVAVDANPSAAQYKYLQVVINRQQD